jgi:hypothetical protein
MLLISQAAPPGIDSMKWLIQKFAVEITAAVELFWWWHILLDVCELAWLCRYRTKFADLLEERKIFVAERLW